MGRGWEWAGEIGEKGMQILVAVRRDLSSPMPFHSAKNAIRFLPTSAIARFGTFGTFASGTPLVPATKVPLGLGSWGVPLGIQVLRELLFV